jgi:hypothetical protein
MLLRLMSARIMLVSPPVHPPIRPTLMNDYEEDAHAEEARGAGGHRHHAGAFHFSFRVVRVTPQTDTIADVKAGSSRQ